LGQKIEAPESGWENRHNDKKNLWGVTKKQTT